MRVYGFIESKWVFIEEPTFFDDIDHFDIIEQQGKCYCQSMAFHEGNYVQGTPFNFEVCFEEIPCCVERIIQCAPELLDKPKHRQKAKIVRIYTAPDGTRGTMKRFIADFRNGQEHGLYSVE